MATHSSILAWKIPWTEEPGRLQSMGSLGVGHDFTFTFHFHALEKAMAAFSCLETPMGGGAWLAAVHAVTKSRTRLSNFTFTFHFQALEKEMATHSSILA